MPFRECIGRLFGMQYYVPLIYQLNDISDIARIADSCECIFYLAQHRNYSTHSELQLCCWSKCGEDPEKFTNTSDDRKEHQLQIHVEKEERRNCATDRRGDSWQESKTVKKPRHVMELTLKTKVQTNLSQLFHSNRSGILRSTVPQQNKARNFEVLDG